jgi:hypothetical protein
MQPQAFNASGLPVEEPSLDQTLANDTVDQAQAYATDPANILDPEAVEEVRVARFRCREDGMGIG